MSVIETFFFQFAADSGPLRKGLEDARKQNDDLGKKLEETDKSASKLGESFTALAKSAGAALAAVFAFHEVKKLTQETADHTYEVYQQARALGIATSALSTWQHAVMASGGTAEGATQSLSTLQEKFREMARFGGMMGPEAIVFEKLGLSAKDMHDSIRDPLIAMQKLSETFGKLDNQQALFLGKKLGLDMGTISLLSQGRRGLDEMLAKQKELGVITDKQALATAKFKLQQVELGLVLETVSREITGTLLPAWTWLLRGIETAITFLREHKTFAISFFGGIAAVITAAYLPAMLSAAAATLAATWPFLLIGAAIAAVVAWLAIAIEDTWAFIHGQNSLIGDVVKKWPIVGEIFRAVGEIFRMFWDLAKMVFAAFIRGVGEMAEAAVELKNRIFAVIEAIVKRFPVLGEAAHLLKVGMKAEIQGIIDSFEWLWRSIKKVFDLVMKAPAKVLNWVGHNLSKATGGKYDDVGSGGDTSAYLPTPAGGKETITQALTGSASLKGVPPEVQAAAEASERKYGIPAAVTLAQWKLESGSGAHMPAGSNNPFGIKARAGEDYVEAMTTEHLNGADVRVMQKFKKFASLEDAFDQHAKLLATAGAYKNARAHSNNPAEFADALTGTYATDPEYGSKLKTIMAGQQQLASAGSAPVNTINSQMIASGGSQTRGDTHVTTGPIAVHTQAQDPDAVSLAMANALGGHIKGALDQYDDGVAI